MCRGRKYLGFGLLFLIAAGLAAWGASYAVEITATPPKVADPGAIITHVFTIRNAGTEDDLYLLEVEMPEGWEFFPRPNSILVRAGDQGYVFINLTVPKEAPAGTYRIALRAVSSGDPAVEATAFTSVEVLPRWDVEVSWMEPPRKLQVGAGTTWRFFVRNAGNVPDVYRVELERFGDWEARLSRSEIHLLPGDEATMEIRAVVPARVRAGESYALRVVVTSVHDPTVSRDLRASGRFLPPPPELVPTSLYPSWEVSLGSGLDPDAGPVFSLHGRGDIELFDYYIDAGLGFSVRGPEEIRFRWEGANKSFYLHGGGIAGMLLGVSGGPLFGGEVEGLGRWRALFDAETKGISLSGEGGGWGLSFAWAESLDAGFSFVDFSLRWSPGRGVALWGAVSQGSDAMGVGCAWQLGGEVSRQTFRLTASYLHVPPGYPHHEPRGELSLRWSGLRGSFPLDLAYRTSVFPRESPPGVVVFHHIRASLPLAAPLWPRLKLDYRRRFSLPPGAVDEQALSLVLSLGGDAPFRWNLSMASSLEADPVAGTAMGSLGFSGSIGVRAEPFELSVGMEASASFGIGAILPASSVELRLRFPGALGSPLISFRAQQDGTRLALSLREVPMGEGKADLGLLYEMNEGKSRWEGRFTFTFTADFPFLGPTRGRITGRLFLDRDGDLAFGPGDEGVEGILLSADGALAITGEEGVFAFPPLPPGTYVVSFVDPPPDLVPLLPPPRVEVVRGEEVRVDIPLRPRAWLRVFVFHDADEDGVPDPGEQGIGGVEVEIIGVGGRWREGTDDTGLFSLELPPGRYKVRLLANTLPQRFSPTTPAEVEVEVPEYGTAEVDFGAYRKPRPVVVTFGPPLAAIEYSPRNPRVGEQVRFSGAGSEAFNAEIVEYRWEFRLGDLAFGTYGPEVTVSFPEPGRWTVTLVVVDSNGLLGAKRVAVEVSP